MREDRWCSSRERGKYPRSEQRPAVAQVFKTPEPKPPVVNPDYYTARPSFERDSRPSFEREKGRFSNARPNSPGSVYPARGYESPPRHRGEDTKSNSSYQPFYNPRREPSSHGYPRDREDSSGGYQPREL
jgi:hypothetical protein